MTNEFIFQTKMAISQMKTKQKNMETEVSRLQKLIKIVEPMNLSKILPDKKTPIPKAAPEHTPTPSSSKESSDIKKEKQTPPNEIPEGPSSSNSSKEEPVVEDETKPDKIPTPKEPIQRAHINKDDSVRGPTLPRINPESKRKSDPPPDTSKSKAPKIAGFGLVTKAELKELKQPSAKKRNVLVEDDEIDAVKDDPVIFLFIISKSLVRWHEVI